MKGSFITKLYNFFRGFFVVGGSHSAEAVKLTATGTGTKVTFSLRFRSSAKKTPLLVSSDWMLKILLNSFYYLYKFILSGKMQNTVETIINEIHHDKKFRPNSNLVFPNNNKLLKGGE